MVLGSIPSWVAVVILSSLQSSLYFFCLFQDIYSPITQSVSLTIFATTPIFPSLGEGDSTGLGAQGHKWILLKTWVIGILSAGEGEGGSVIWSESDLAQ